MIEVGQEALLAMLEAIRDGVILADTETRKFVWGNTSACEMLGCSAQELTTLSVDDIHPPEELPWVMMQFARQVRKELTLALDIPVRTRAGKLFYADINSAPAVLSGKQYLMGVFRDVTERKRADKARLASEDKYRSLFDDALDMIHIVDPDGRLVDANRCELETLGYTREEHLGRPLLAIIPPAQHEAAKAQLKRILKGKVLRNFELNLVTKDGREIPVEVNAFPQVVDGKVVHIRSIVRNVAARQQAARDLRDSEARFRAVFEGAGLGIVLGQVGTDILYTNPRLQQMLGYTDEEINRLGIRGITHPDDFAADYQLFQELMNGKRPSYQLEKRYLRKDGQIMWCNLTVTAIAGPQPTYVAMVEDITERRRAADERRLLEAKVQTTQRLQSLGVLTGGIAHDFNNLLTSILGNANLVLQDPAVSPLTRDCVSEVETAARHAAGIVRQLLTYAGKARLVPEPLDLTVLVRDMTHLLAISISKKAVLHERFATHLPAIRADASQMRQVAMNLIMNASDALADKPGDITVTTGVMICDRTYFADAVAETAPPAGTYVFLEVTDTGCGMNSETQQRIFDPFFTTKATGHGLGLAAMLGIVRAHKGTIKLQTAPGHGTTFRILFPALDAAIKARPAAGATPAQWRGHGTILVADDQPAIRLLSQRVLEPVGFTVLVAEDGRGVIELFEAHAPAVVCVILDRTMPVLDGEQAMNDLRALNPALPVILTSGYGEDEIAAAYRGEKPTAFMQKPFTAGMLLDIVRQTLAKPVS